MSGEEWDNGGWNGEPAPRNDPKPEQWYRLNAAVFYAWEEWQRAWDAYASEYDGQHGRPPSSANREKNKAMFRRKLIAKYGRGEPDDAWVGERISHLDRRGMAPERTART